MRISKLLEEASTKAEAPGRLRLPCVCGGMISFRSIVCRTEWYNGVVFLPTIRVYHVGLRCKSTFRNILARLLRFFYSVCYLFSI